MSEMIGQAAGNVWQYLKENGPATASQMQKALKADAALANQALGWLAREGKLNVDRSKRVATYRLAE